MLWDICVVCLLGYLVLVSVHMDEQYATETASAAAMASAFVHASRGGSYGIGSLLVSCNATQIVGEYGHGPEDVITLYY